MKCHLASSDMNSIKLWQRKEVKENNIVAIKIHASLKELKVWEWGGSLIIFSD